MTGPTEPTRGAADAADETPTRSSLHRRTFLKAAALGTAVAGLSGMIGRNREGGLRLGPVAAYADNLSGLKCTANDVRIIGPAQILNEPCTCTGTFNAQVKFRVNNNTGTTRYCVKVHFCPGALPGGGTFDPGDVLIGDIPPGEADYTVTIPNYPCGSGLVCFGARGPEADGGFPKGADCPSGQCCTTISWDVNPGCPTRTITSKCRHQQVCIQGRGVATLDCNTSTAGVQASCAVTCGGSTTVQLCTTEAASFGPFTFVLKVPGQTDQTFTGAGPCHDFTVSGLTAASTTITGEVTSNDTCKKTATTTLTTTPITASLAVTGNSACNSGQLTFTASPAGGTYTFRKDGTIVQGPNTTNTYVYTPTVGSGGLDTGCHAISVHVVSSGGCEADATSHVSQCVTSTVATGACPP